MGMVLLAVVATIGACMGGTALAQSSPVKNGDRAGGTGIAREADPRAAFERGQSALAKGDLDEAEKSFRQVVLLDPKSASAYANLGVIAMRRKQWSVALTDLHKAEKLAPTMTGVRLNFGLA